MNKVSVLMPAYNAERYVLKSVNAILAQSHENLELLICDDASTDATFQLLSGISDERVKIYKNDENLGYLKTCNKLAALATGCFISFQDADDEAHSERFEKLLAALIKNQWDLVGSNVNYINELGQTIGRSYYSLDVSPSFLADNDMPFCGSAVLCKRKVITEIGLYDEAFDRLGAEDYDWIYRAALIFTLGNVEQPLYSYRMHADSVSNLTSLRISSQLFTEHIAKELYIARKNNQLTLSPTEFITQKKIYWTEHLAHDQTAILLKKSSINALSGKKISNLTLIWPLLCCPSTLNVKLRAVSLVILAIVLGYGRLFKLKTFYKKIFCQH